MSATMTATATLTDVPQSSMPQHLRQSQPILSRVRKQLQVQLPKLTPIAFWNLHDKYVADQRRIDPDAGNLQQLAIGSLGLCVLIIGTLWYLLAIGGDKSSPSSSGVEASHSVSSSTPFSSSNSSLFRTYSSYILPKMMFLSSSSHTEQPTGVPGSASYSPIIYLNLTSNVLAMYNMIFIIYGAICSAVTFIFLGLLSAVYALGVTFYIVSLTKAWDHEFNASGKVVVRRRPTMLSRATSTSSSVSKQSTGSRRSTRSGSGAKKSKKAQFSGTISGEK